MAVEMHYRPIERTSALCRYLDTIQGEIVESRAVSGLSRAIVGWIDVALLATWHVGC